MAENKDLRDTEVTEEYGASPSHSLYDTTFSILNGYSINGIRLFVLPLSFK